MGIKDYRFDAVDDLLGEGSFGQVYRAVSRDGRTVALKLIRRRDGTSPAQWDMILRTFERETTAARHLNSEHVVRVYDSGWSDDRSVLFLAMELVPEKRTLDALLAAGGPPALPRALNIACQVAAAVAEIHKANFVHRDLKPANIGLVRHAGNPDFVKILDFGLCKPLDPEIRVASMTSCCVGGFGTPLYMAPEQLEPDKPVDFRADVYALGGVLFELISGRPPLRIEGQAWRAVLCNERPHPLGEVRPDPSRPREFDVLVERCLEKNPDARVQTAAEVVEDLEAICRAVRGSRPEPGKAAQGPAPPGSVAPVVPLGGGVAPTVPSPAVVVPETPLPGPAATTTRAPPAMRRAVVASVAVVAVLLAVLLAVVLAPLLRHRGASQQADAAGMPATSVDAEAATVVASAAPTGISLIRTGALTDVGGSAASDSGAGASPPTARDVVADGQVVDTGSDNLVSTVLSSYLFDAGRAGATDAPPPAAPDAALSVPPTPPTPIPPASATHVASGGEKCLGNLCWQDPPAPSRMNWQSAMDYCAHLNLTGRGAGEWHLPIRDELASLSNAGAGCEGRGGFHGTCSWYWSSSSYTESASYAWFVTFGTGYVSSYRVKEGWSYVRCVRRGP